MKQLFDQVSANCSKLATRTYSTSFSLGIHFLSQELHQPIYAIYGFVRSADEIVDSFHGFEQSRLLNEFRKTTYDAIEAGISLNPILNSFQATVNRFGIERDLIETFLDSMRMDLQRTTHDHRSFQQYVLGSAEVVGLMCLRIFCNGDDELYRQLQEPAMRLGAAFQKVNFLRDLHADYQELRRVYFPSLRHGELPGDSKSAIEREINEDFRLALAGIKRLPRSARFGVYVAYVYYSALLRKIESTSGDRLLQQRLRVPNVEKLGLLVNSFLRYNLGWL